MTNIFEKRVHEASKELDKASVLAFGFVSRPEAAELASKVFQESDKVIPVQEIAEVLREAEDFWDDLMYEYMRDVGADPGDRFLFMATEALKAISDLRE